MKTSYEYYKEYQKTVRAILRRYKIQLKENNNFADKGSLKDRLKAFNAFFKLIEKEMNTEENKTLKMAKGSPDIDNLAFGLEVYKMKKGVEFISKNKPQ
jgi:hypothetical protein